jgi:hypothetical protein
MAKIDIVKMNADAVASYRADPNKNVNKIVGDTLTAYAKVAVRLHYTACIVLFHAAETGDIRAMNAFFGGLRQNDRDAFRIWAGKLCSYQVEQEAVEGEPQAEPKDMNFLLFSKDTGFRLAKKSDAVRVGFFDLDELIAGKSFMDVDQAKEKADFDLAALLAMLAKVEKNMSKKAKDNNVEVPVELLAAVKSLTQTTNKVANTAGITLQ